ncbi:MAG: Gfo/Idh/MocA family oxidoreductase, partial [Oscillospiraceae bacterium]
MIKVVIVGFGNIGKFALDAVLASKDMELLGIIKRHAEENEKISGYAVVENVGELGEKPDVALLCVPTSKVLEQAKNFHKQGISTVDCFDRHQDILMLRKELEKSAKENGVKAVISAGWDPGSDSVVRTLLEAIAPIGITNTN